MHPSAKTMLHILYGSDDFSIHEALNDLKAHVGPVDVLDANVTVSQASAISPGELIAMCNTVPFLAERRMAVVEGLLAQFEGQRSPRRGRGRNAEADSSSWLSIVEHIPAMPPSSDLVLVDGVIRRDNSLLTQLAPLGQVREFQQLRGADLTRWIEKRAAERGCNISRAGVRLLAELVGGNLWALSGEVEKLSLYCQDRTVEAEDVELLVPLAREMSIFNAVDAVMEGRYADALRTIKRLMEEGAGGQYIIVMVARQVRLLLLAKDLAGSGVPQQQMGRRLGLNSDWVLRKTLEQGRRHSRDALEALHRGLLETDRAVKTGRITENSVGEFLVEVFARVS